MQGLASEKVPGIISLVGGAMKKAQSRLSEKRSGFVYFQSESIQYSFRYAGRARLFR